MIIQNNSTLFRTELYFAGNLNNKNNSVFYTDRSQLKNQVSLIPSSQILHAQLAKTYKINPVSFKAVNIQLPRILVISGPSGIGKGDLIKRVMQKYPDTYLSVSATTRLPRDGEIDGIDYKFISKEKFLSLEKENEFIESACPHEDEYYGTLRKPVEKALASGKSVILEINIDGAKKIKEEFSDAFLLFFRTPSLQELEQRLRGRGTETEEKILKRLATAKKELTQTGIYDNVLISGTREEDLRKFEEIFSKENE